MNTQRQLRLIPGGAAASTEVADRLARDARVIARSWWGKPRAEWVEVLARDLFDRAGPALHRHRRASWVAGLLVAAAIAEGMHRSTERWELVVADIELTTGVSRSTAFACWRHLVRLDLAIPAHPPPYWDDEWDCTPTAAPDHGRPRRRRLAVVPMN